MINCYHTQKKVFITPAKGRHDEGHQRVRRVEGLRARPPDHQLRPVPRALVDAERRRGVRA